MSPAFTRIAGAFMLLALAAACSPVPAATTLPPPSAIPTSTAVPATPTSPPKSPTATEVPSTAIPTSEYPLATSIEDILGVWKGLGPHPLYNQFNPDGTQLVARALDSLPDHPAAVQVITFEGTLLKMVQTIAPDLPSCGEKVGIYQVQLVEPGLIKFITVDDPCSKRRSSTEGLHKKVE